MGVGEEGELGVGLGGGIQLFVALASDVSSA